MLWIITNIIIEVSKVYKSITSTVYSGLMRRSKPSQLSNLMFFQFRDRYTHKDVSSSSLIKLSSRGVFAFSLVHFLLFKCSTIYYSPSLFLLKVHFLVVPLSSVALRLELEGRLAKIASNCSGVAESSLAMTTSRFSGGSASRQACR